MIAMLLAAASLSAAPALSAPLPSALAGSWINPHRSVVVRTGPCGDGLCGWISWVNGEAAADAREGGVAQPVGTEVLRDYRPAGDGSWSGTVFVLDLGRSFRSTIVPLAGGRLKISGCLVGTFLCKSQIWRRF